MRAETAQKNIMGNPKTKVMDASDWPSAVMEHLLRYWPNRESYAKRLRPMLELVMSLGEDADEQDAEVAFFAMRQGTTSIGLETCGCDNCVAELSVTGAYLDVLVVRQHPYLPTAIAKLAKKHGVLEETLKAVQIEKESDEHGPLH